LGADLSTSAAPLHLLAADHDPAALRDISHLLAEHPMVGAVAEAADATQVLRLLQREHFDAAFLDVLLPGLGGLELARLLALFAHPPQVVFVAPHGRHAVEAFDLHALDYLLKPVGATRLAEAVRRVARARYADDEPVVTVPVELNRRTVLIERSRVRYVETCGDYVRLHCPEGSYLVRVPMSSLEWRWAEAGFVRIHRRYLIALRHLNELRTGASGGHVVRVDGVELAVSRRHIGELKSRLAELALQGGLSPSRRATAPTA
jgi:DNA-binding LytR/AlgR family response regulator